VRGSERIEIGGVARAHGIRGEVVVVLHDPDSGALDRAESLWIDGAHHVVTSVRPGPHGWLVKLEGIDDRNRAELLRGHAVEMARDELELTEGEIVLDDLIGCRAVLPDGQPWGEVVAIQVGPQDRLVIHDGGLERLVPLVDELVVAIDLEAGQVTINPPEGLPEIPVEQGYKIPKR